ncbi:complement C1q-like protein 2 [Mytilus trossulus]|uniref:complement C1q-like protein 2 n=1 Tax=Mytilus trossulus TaxID=6551 RepID=UPI0030073195
MAFHKYVYIVVILELWFHECLCDYQYPEQYVKEMLDNFNDRLTMMQKESTYLRDEFENLKRECLRPKDLQQMTDTRKRILLAGADSKRIAFSTTLTHNAVLGYHTPIEFDRIITNVGNAYDSSDGHFIAPIKGLYLISVSIMNVEGHEEYTEIVRNGVQYVAMYSDDDDYSMASQTIVVLLETGDKVWVRKLFGGSATILGHPNEPYNTFSGVLLFEM